jgi:hypothetical protein
VSPSHEKQNNAHTDTGYFSVQPVAFKALAEWLAFFWKMQGFKS